MNDARPRMRIFATVAVLFVGAALHAQDAEKATHAAGDAMPERTLEEKGAGWTMRQYRLGCLSLLSYLVVSDGRAAVIDPQRDVDRYLDDAKELGAKIDTVILTHSHADFVAGHTEIAAITGAKIYVDRDSGAEYPHVGVADGEKLAFAAVGFEFWKTPGHVLASLTILMRTPDAKVDPAYLFTGDTLFIGGVGRPDLTDIPAGELASMGFDSIRRLKTLPDGAVVLPAHGAGSLCGAHLSSETKSTIGAEKATNPFLKIDSRARYVATLLEEKTYAPAYFGKNVELNRRGPPVVRREEPPKALTPADAKTAIAAGAWVIDLRTFDAYAAGHIEGSVNIGLRGRLDTWTGTVVPFDAPMILVGSDAETIEGAFRLRRIGYDRPLGRLAADMPAWQAAGLGLRTTRPIAADSLAKSLGTADEPLVIDVRTENEWKEAHIPGALNFTLTDWQRYGRVLDKKTPVVFACNSAYRSAMAVGLAEKAGLADAASLDGGLDRWLTEGRAATGTTAVCVVGAAPAGEAPAVRFITPKALAEALLSALPPVVLDLRSADAMAEWKPRTARAVSGKDIAAAIRDIPEQATIVVMDQDTGTAAALVGALGVSAPDLAKRVLVLDGGARRYWREIMLKRPSNAAEPMPVSAPAESPKLPKKRNPGC